MDNEHSDTYLKPDTRLDELNRKIWESGFDSITLSELDKVAKEINDGRTIFERIPQEQQSGLSARYGFLCQAAVICRGCPRTESESREIYRTDDLIGDGKIQQTLIETWARQKGIWHEDAGNDYGMHLNYKTSTLYIGDLNEFNVIKGNTGIQVIDADCRLNIPTLGCDGLYIIPQPGFQP